MTKNTHRRRPLYFPDNRTQKSVFTLPFGADPIAGVAAHVLSRYKDDFSNVAVVFGGKRPALFLKRHLSRELKKPFFPPVFFSQDEFARHIVDRCGQFQKARDMESAFFLYDAARSSAPEILAGRQSFSRFLPWARELLSFIEQLDLQNVPDEKLIGLQENASIGYDVPESINSLLRHTSVIRQAFHRRLEEEGKLTRGMIYAKAASRVNDLDFAEFNEVIFCNFFYLHSTEEKILSSLYERGKATLFFQRDNREWSVFEGLEKTFSCRIQPEPASAKPPRISLHSGPGIHAQVARVSAILSSADPAKTVIVLPDPAAAVPLLSSLAGRSFELNVSLGYPLQRSSLYGLLQLISRTQKSRKGSEYYCRDYIRTLSHPLIKNLSFSNDPALTRIIVHKIRDMLSGALPSEMAGVLFIELESLQRLKVLDQAVRDTANSMELAVSENEIKDALDRLHRLVFSGWEGVVDFKGFCSGVEQLLGCLSERSTLEEYPLNVRIAEQIRSLCREFTSGVFSGERFPPEDMFGIFLDALSSSGVSFAGSPLKGLQVLGLFETRALSFDTVIILDANERILPKLNLYEPLIPREIMLSLGLNRLEKEDEIQRYQFLRLIGGASQAHILFDDSPDKEKSRFVEEIIWEKQKETGTLFSTKIARGNFWVSSQEGKASREKTPAMSSFLREKLFSASSVNTYLQCPAKFFYRYVLGLKETPELSEEPEAADVGTFLHEFLEEALTPWKGKQPVWDERSKEGLRQLLSERFEKKLVPRMKADALFLKRIIEVRMEAFFKKEGLRPVDRIVSLEEEVRERLTFEDVGSFAFTCRMDRIDRLSDGTIVVIDYKTGSTNVKPAACRTVEANGFGRQELKKTVKSFQLPLYYRSIRSRFPQETPVNAALYDLRSSEITWLFGKESEEEKEQAMGVYMRALGQLMKELVRSEQFIADDSEASFCALCEYFNLCR